MQLARQIWREAQPAMDIGKLVFLDETWASTSMTRKCGRAPRGLRGLGSAPHGHWKTTTFVAGLSLDGIVAPVVFDGPIDGPSFLAYVEQMVCPRLRPGHVLLMDNLSSHKQPAVEAAVRAVGASIFFTPPYSPDLNPIENFFSKLKAHLRKVQARTKFDLDAAIAVCCAALTRTECENFFLHCGYGVT